MPPKKRGRAAAAAKGKGGGLQPIVEEEHSPAQKQEAPCPQPVPQEARDAHGRTKQEVIKFIEDEVTERIQALLATGRELAADIRADAQMACLRMPKKVREMTVADFFQLSPEEAHQTTLTDLGGRLSTFAAPVGGVAAVAAPSTAKPSTDVPATPACPSTAAPTTRTTRRTAARTTAGLPQQQQQQAAPPTATRAVSRATRSSRPTEGDVSQPQQQQQVAPSGTKRDVQQQQQQEEQEQGHGEGGAAEPCSPPVADAAAQAAGRSEHETAAAAGPHAGVLRDSTNQRMHAAGAQKQSGAAGVKGDEGSQREGLMPPPPPKRGAKHDGKQTEAEEKTECGEENVAQPAVASTPLPPQQQASVAATPVGAQGTQAGLLASASNLMSNTMQSLPGGASLMAGFTLMRRTVSRGRTRRAADDENAIMISTSDGRQFMVDAGTGLANVPDKYRKEVAAQLEVIQRLSAAALNIRQ